MHLLWPTTVGQCFKHRGQRICFSFKVFILQLFTFKGFFSSCGLQMEYVVVICCHILYFQNHCCVQPNLQSFQWWWKCTNTPFLIYLFSIPDCSAATSNDLLFKKRKNWQISRKYLPCILQPLAETLSFIPVLSPKVVLCRASLLFKQKCPLWHHAQLCVWSKRWALSFLARSLTILRCLSQ